MQVIQGELIGEGLRIGIVTSRFNPEITERLEQGALSALRRMGVREEEIAVVRVPGAYEIPLAAMALMESEVDGVVALGAVIRGDTSHYDYVCASVERGCSDVQLDYGRPVGFGVLTCDTDEQALDRAGGKHGNKGADAAEATVEMARLSQKLFPE
jgi:6,7-dimethyl-8-ribityllumazine synthase